VLFLEAFISALRMCNNCRIGEDVRRTNCFLLIGSHVWKGRKPLIAGIHFFDKVRLSVKLNFLVFCMLNDQ